MIKSTSIELVN